MNNTILKSLVVTLLVSTCLLSGCNSKSKNSNGGVPPQVLMQERQKNAQLQAAVRNLGAGMQAMGTKLSHVTNSLAQKEHENRLMAQYVIAAQKRHEATQQKLQAMEKEKAKAEKAAKESLALLKQDAKKVEKEPKESLSFLNEDATKAANKQKKQQAQKRKATAAYYRESSEMALKINEDILKRLARFLRRKDVRERTRRIGRKKYPINGTDDNYIQARRNLLKRVRIAQHRNTAMMAASNEDKGYEIFNQCSKGLLNETEKLQAEVNVFGSRLYDNV